MTTVADNQDALNFRDRWPRGVNYTRYLQLTDANGNAIDLSSPDDFSVLTMSVQGPSNSSPLSPVISAVYDDTRGGAASGAITVQISAATLETGWPDSGQSFTNQISWTLKAATSPSDPNERPIFNCTIAVYDTAFA